MFSRINHWFGNGWMGILELLITALCVFFSLSVHEFAHGYAAYKLGDSTAKYMGRLNLSPKSHLDPIGAICLFLFGFGWAKPVPVNPRNFKEGKMKSGMVWTSVAGPLANVLLAFIAVLLLRIISAVFANIYMTNEVIVKIISIFVIVLQVLISMNLSLAVFNIIPIPPLDGSKILNAVLPGRIYFKIMQYEQYGFIILLILINTRFFSWIMNGLINLILTGMDFAVGLIPFL